MKTKPTLSQKAYFLSGLGLISYGLYLIWPPLMYIGLGVYLVSAMVIAVEGKSKKQEHNNGKPREEAEVHG